MLVGLGGNSERDLAAGIVGGRDNFRMFSAGLLKSEGASWLFTKGALSVIERPALHWGDVMVLKSPASMAAVGTKAMRVGGSERVIVP